eukprot:918219-Karenia_brevis.AAC.1
MRKHAMEVGACSGQVLSQHGQICNSAGNHSTSKPTSGHRRRPMQLLDGGSRPPFNARSAEQ